MASASATVHGFLSDNPVVTTTKNGNKIAKIRLGWSNKIGGEVKWSNINVNIWGREADVAEQYLEKGSKVTIIGELETNTWEKDGEKKSMLVLNCLRLKLEGKAQGDGEKKERSAPSKPAGKPASKPATKQADDFPEDEGFGDIPF